MCCQERGHEGQAGGPHVARLTCADGPYAPARYARVHTESAATMAAAAAAAAAALAGAGAAAGARDSEDLGRLL